MDNAPFTLESPHGSQDAAADTAAALLNPGKASNMDPQGGATSTGPQVNNEELCEKNDPEPRNHLDGCGGAGGDEPARGVAIGRLDAPPPLPSDELSGGGISSTDAELVQNDNETLGDQADNSLVAAVHISRLVHTQSSPSLLQTLATEVQTTTSCDNLQTLAALGTDMAAPYQETDASEASTSSSISDTSSSSSSSTSASLSPPPPPVSLATASGKSSSYNNARSQSKDTSLRIFFPTDDLALKAILSPPIVRPPPPPATTTMTAAKTAAMVATRGDAKPPSFAESILEQTTRLFFSRGNSDKDKDKPTDASAAVAATPPPQPPAPPATVAPPAPFAPPHSRPSTTSVALEDDLSALLLTHHPNLPPPPFANMFSCENCHDDIGSLLTQGRHHCRNCGGSFCATCSSKSIMVPYQLYLSKKEPQRVCESCFNRISDFHVQAQTTQVTWSGLPPPSADLLALEFDLPEHEKPVTVFNCSYFVDFAPFYGHLILTRANLCFRGYPSSSTETTTTKIKLPFHDFHSLVKPEFYYINALQITTKAKKEKYFFAEFNGLRDLCFLRIDQLIRAFQDGKKKQNHGQPPLSSDQLKQQALSRRRSYKLLVNGSGSSSTITGDEQLASFMASSSSATAGFLDVDDDEDDDDDGERNSSSVPYSEEEEERDERERKRPSMSCGSSETTSEEGEGTIPFVPLSPDPLLAKMTVLLDCELRADVESVFDSLWSNGTGQDFLRGHMGITKDIDIDVGDWHPIDNSNISSAGSSNIAPPAGASTGFVISKEDDYTFIRYVRSQHPPKIKFPGLPAYATCCRTQKLRVEKNATGTNQKWNRFIVSEVLRMAKIPFSDSFEIETRWVFTRDGKNYCHVQTGLFVNYLKSTWFKSQIDSSTKSESKEAFEIWTQNALQFLQEQTVGNGRKSSSAAEATTGVRRRSSASGPQEEVAVAMAAVAAPQAKRLSSTPRKMSNQQSTSPAATTVTADHQPQQLGQPSPSRSMVQWVTLLLLLYCVVLLQVQQFKINQLSHTTAQLMTKLDERYGHPKWQPPMECTVGDVCE